MVVPERRTEQRGGGERGGDPGYRLDVHIGRCELQCRGRHGVHARVAGPDERDRVPLGRERHGGTGPLLLFSQPAVEDPGPRRQQVPDLVQVLVEPDDDGGPAQRFRGPGRPQVVGARAQPDDGEPAARYQPRDGDGRHGAGPLRDDEVGCAAGAAGTQEGRRFGHGRRTDGRADHLGGVRHVDRRQVGGRPGQHRPAGRLGGG